MNNFDHKGGLDLVKNYDKIKKFVGIFAKIKHNVVFALGLYSNMFNFSWNVSIIMHCCVGS